MKSEELKNREYKYGFTTDIENFKAPKGLSEETIRFISKIKKEPQWMLDWRLKAFNRLKVLKEPNWQKPKYPKIDYQDLYYYSAPKNASSKPKDIKDLDPKILETYKKLGIPLEEQKRLNGIAVDAVFDSVSVATTFKEKLNDVGVIFCSISEAIKYAEGLQENASIRDIKILKSDGSSSTFDLYKFLVFGDRSIDINLQNGDTVLVSATSN